MYRYYTNVLAFKSNSRFYYKPFFNVDKLNIVLPQKVLFNLSKLCYKHSFIDREDYFFNVYHLSKNVRVISSPFHSYLSVSGCGRNLKEVFKEVKRWLKKVGYKFKENDFIKRISYIEVFKDIPEHYKGFSYSYIWFGSPRKQTKIKNTEYQGSRGHKQKVKYQRPQRTKTQKGKTTRIELRLWKCQKQNAKIFKILLVFLGYFISLISVPGISVIKSFEMLDITCLYNKSPPFLFFSAYKCG